VSAFRDHVHRFLAHWEHRSVQLVSLAALALALSLAAVVPFPHSPAKAIELELARRPPAPPPVVLPPPRPGDAAERAVVRAARKDTAIRHGGGRHRLIALTFDDGPGPYTRDFLVLLAHLHVPATFFQVGRMLDQFSQAAAATSEAPDVAIGDHSFSHRPMDRLDRALQRDEVLRAAAAMIAHGEAPPRLFRPPYGSWDRATHQLLERRGMAMILWSVDSQDYRRPGVRRIVHNVVSAAEPGAIVLMHDAGGDRTQTLHALPYIVRKLRRSGYTLVTVPELLRRDPPR
jgi:peptidoglycan/xylan/chitin deacetylase (PgdA/CDA1 family)